MNRPHTLVIGWGNPGRLDDGLGPAFAAALDRFELPWVSVQSDYQLQVESVADVARHDRVLFVDADRSGPAPFSVRPIRASNESPGFTTHSVSPAAVLTLSRDLFGSTPEAWLVGVRGYRFDDFGEGLSRRARQNLDAALTFIRDALGEDALCEVPLRELSPDPTNDSQNSTIELKAEVDHDPRDSTQAHGTLHR